MTTAGPNRGFFPRGSLRGEEEEGYIADEVAQESVEVLAQPPSEGQDPETLPLSGLPNRWRRSGWRTQSPQQDTTILLLTVDPRSWRERNLERWLLRAAENGLVDLDQPDPRGRTNLLASGA